MAHLIFILLISLGLVYGRIIIIGPCKFAFDVPCENDYLKIWLYTRKTQEKPELVGFLNNWDNISSSNFDPSRPNTVLIHGYSSSYQLSFLQDLKNNLLRTAETNVWMVDWEQLAAGPCYPAAVYNLKHSGKCLATFLTRLRIVVPAAEPHVVGFSLGAHVASSAAFHLTPYLLPRITGLDPAVPLFIRITANHKLSSSDAAFVDVLHTNGLFQGDIEQTGHVDFYLNGGVTQPGCSLSPGILNCDHHRAVEYFAESVLASKDLEESHLFLGVPCTSTLSAVDGSCHRDLPPDIVPDLMGYFVSNNSRGAYYVRTRDHKPFAAGKWWLDPEFSSQTERVPQSSKLSVASV